MFQKAGFVLLYSSIVIPVFLWCGALPKYTIPEFTQESPAPKKSIDIIRIEKSEPSKKVKEDIYSTFKKEIHNLTIKEKEKLRKHYLEKNKTARGKAKEHYSRLIKILTEELKNDYKNEVIKALKENNDSAKKYYMQRINELEE